MVKFKTTSQQNYTLVEFEIEGGVIAPEELKQLTPPKVDLTKLVVLSGRGPIWLYLYLAHHYHTTPALASYDPRVGGAVITQTHSPKYKIGEIVPL